MGVICCDTPCLVRGFCINCRRQVLGVTPAPKTLSNDELLREAMRIIKKGACTSNGMLRADSFLEQAVKAVLSLRTSPWIALVDQKPPKGQRVLWGYKDSAGNTHGEVGILTNGTHWMEIPPL